MIDVLTPTHATTIAPQHRVLNAADAALVWVLKWSGDADHVIAHKLGTMPTRIADILAENTHVGSRDKASKMVERTDGH
ncbi:hypothetical protein [uncultured Tateyamaria sp.]|uniref:hypothetical protein n=1 Tax=uncultured Tateyamaria sp. TaxID=455651 RepID=UPI0026074D5F|nr:hypothetical protein [uncultured Tateyamaria sp.]